MRLVDESGKQIFFQYAFLTRNEAQELIRVLQEMLGDEPDNDVHFFDEEHSWYSKADVWEGISNAVMREIRLCIYDRASISEWSEPIQRIIRDYPGDIESVELGPHA